MDNRRLFRAPSKWRMFLVVVVDTLALVFALLSIIFVPLVLAEYFTGGRDDSFHKYPTVQTTGDKRYER